MKNIDDLKIPLIVSVAGHIDVAVPESVLQGYFTEFWQQLRKKFGPSTPFVLLSSLAAGADHLAVKYRPADVPYCAVLPFAQEVYEKDFTGSALEDFRADLRGAFKTVVCGGGPGDYTAAAEYIRTRADIIITLWDGMEALDKNGNVSKGGTYYTVRKVLQLDKLLISSKEKAHLLVNFPVVRRKVYSGGERKIFDSSTWGTLTVEKGGINFTPDLVFPEGSAVAENAGNIRKYNDSLQDRGGERNYLYRDFSERFHDQYKIIEKDFLRHEYFDRIATENQKCHKREFMWIAIISVVAGLLGQAWGDVTFSANEAVHEWVVHGVILFYFLSCICAFLYYRGIRKHRHYEKYIQPRAIAELMRLNIFWKLSSIKESFFDYLLGDNGDHWCALPICNWETADLPLNETVNDLSKESSAVMELWIKDQKNFYKGYILSDPCAFFKVQRDEVLPSCTSPGGCVKFIKKYFRPYQRIDGYISFFKTLFFWSGFGLASVLLLVFILARLKVIPALTDHVSFLHLGYYREILIGLCPFIVATLGWLLEKKQWLTIGKRYGELYNAFSSAETQLKVLPKEENKQELIKELVLLSYQENSEWEEIKKGTSPEPMF